MCAVSGFAARYLNPENHVRLCFDGTPVLMDTVNRIMYASVKPDVLDDFKPVVTVDLEQSDDAAAKMTLALGNSGTLHELPHTFNVTQWPSREWVMRMNIGGKTSVWNLVVTTLPLVNVDVNLKSVDRLYAAESDAKTGCSVWMIDPQGRLEGGVELDMRGMIKVSTFTNADYGKKPYALELIDGESGAEMDVDLFGLRKDGDWVLDAMYCDPSRMRNRVVTDVWNSINSLPYDRERVNGAQGEFVELFVNSQYYGLYCFTEKIDRKALGVKKSDGESVSGMVLRAQKSNDATMLYDYADDAVASGGKWCGWTQVYPDNGAYRWDLMKSLISVAGYGDHSWSNYSRLSKEFSNWFYMDNCVDYFLLLNSFYLFDNTNRNYYLSFYDTEKNFRALFTPGSLEGSLGRNSGGQTLYSDETRSGFNSKIIKRIGFFNRMVTDNTLKFNNRLRSHWDNLKTSNLSVDKVSKKINSYKKLLVRSGAYAREKAKWPDTTAEDMDIEVQKMIDWYGWNFEIIDSYLTTNYAPYEGGDEPSDPSEKEDPISSESVIPVASNYAGFTVRPSQVFVNGMPAVVDTKNLKLFVSLHPDSCTNLDYTVTTTYQDVTLSADGKQYGESVSGHLTDCNDISQCLYVKVGSKVAKYAFEFTTLPIICIDTDWKRVLALSDEDRDAKVAGYVYIVDAQRQTDGQAVYAHRIATKVRGASARDYDKKSLAMEIRDEEMGEMTEDAFIFGLREDDDWVLDAMYVDKSRMRNRTLTDIWNSFSDLPYAKDNEYQFNGTHGQHVEMILNGKYNGLYCLTDKVDRKKLNLKKTQAVDENTVSIRGLLYKGKKWTDATNMHNYDINDTGEGKTMWQGYEQQYPDEDPSLATWEPLQDFLQLCCDENIKGLDHPTYSRLSKEYQDYFYMENLVDYWLFYNAFTLYDNSMKNAFLSIRNLQKDKKMLFTPWDLDASLGRTPTAADWSGDDVYYAFGRKLVYRNGLLIKLVLDNPFKFHTMLHTRWNKLKNAQLSVENVMKRFRDYAHKLETSGAWRREHNRWPEHADENLQEEIQFIEKFYTKNYAMFEAYISKYPSMMLEDVNGDGTIDTQDVLQIYDFMKNASGLELTPAEDVNCDGGVDTQDVLEIYDYMKGN